MRERKILLAAILGIALSTTNAQSNSEQLKIATCNFDNHQHQVPTNQKTNRGYIGNSNVTTDVYALESRPGAPFCILLDFDGNGTDGKGVYRGFGNNLYQTVNPSDDYVQKIWDHMADDFIAFNVNVTTNEAVFDSYQTSNKILAAFAEFGLPGWKGIAYVGSFGNGNAALIDVDMLPATNDAAVDARVGSHEVGHSLGLSHDGGGGDPYYSGHGEYVPIMGSGSVNLTHWSKGEYSSATNQEDDVTIIAQTLGFVDDDILQFKELQYNANGVVSANDNKGTITSRSDKDLFKFEMKTAGNIDVTVSTSILWSNLDVRLRLLDENKNEIISVNPVGQRAATISTTISSEGIYYLEIDGDGELSVNTGWSDYSSMGYYEISGIITGFNPILYDANLSDISGFGDVCEAHILPEVSITNNGENTIDELVFDLFIDANFFRSETIQVGLNPGVSNVYQLNELTEIGEHDISIQVGIKNQQDQISFNNSLSSSYNLIQGKTFRFETDYDEFNGFNPFVWNVIKETSKVEVTNSKQVTIDNSVSTQQDFCLTAGCYDFKMVGDFDPCLAYSPYSSGTYDGGETVALNGNLYKAKWWTNTQPPSSEWESLGACPSVNASFKLTDIDEQDEVLNEASTALNGNYSKSFCVNLPTGLEEGQEFANSLNIYPNPVNNVINIKSNSLLKTITIRTLTGAIVLNENVYSKSEQIDLTKLNAGMYLLEVEGETSIEAQLILKR